MTKIKSNTACAYLNFYFELSFSILIFAQIFGIRINCYSWKPIKLTSDILQKDYSIDLNTWSSAIFVTNFEEIFVGDSCFYDSFEFEA